MSIKIEEHPQIVNIEAIILKGKFKGDGSQKIRTSIVQELGVEISRPTIDKYYNERMNGELLSSLINEQAEALRRSEASGNGGGLAPPSVDLDKLEEIKKRYSGLSGDKSKLQALRESFIVMIECNLEAYINGDERLKPEYAKYLKDLESVLKSKS